MRSLIVLGVLAQSACLFAPSRPADTGSDGGGGTPGDGGDDGNTTACAPNGTVYGVSLVVTRGGVERLLRVGHVDSSGWFLYTFAPDTPPGACAQSRVKVAGGRVTSVDAIVPAFNGATLTDLLVLGALGTTDSAVIDLAVSGGTVNEVGRVTIANYRAQPITTSAGSDPAAFVAWDRSRELWFGGGTTGLAVASVPSGLTGTATVTTTSSAEGWYGGIALRNPHGAKRFALIGTTASYEAAHNGGGAIAVSATTAHACAAPCSRLAFTVPAPIIAAGATIEAFSVDRATGAVETIESKANGIVVAAYTPSSPGTGAVLDVAIGDVVGDTAIDAAVLWGSPTQSAPAQLIVYDGLVARDTSTAIGPVALDSRITRVVVTGTGAGARILALSGQAGIDRCLRVAEDGRSLADCP